MLDKNKPERCIVVDDFDKEISVKRCAVRPVPRMTGPSFGRSAEPSSVPASLRASIVPAYVPAERCQSLGLLDGLDGGTHGGYPVGQWMDLPYDGGNKVRLMPREAGDKRMLTCMYPSLADYVIEFQSMWGRGQGIGIITLEDFDILDLCPQGQIWPKCSFCNHGCFLLPPWIHRRSKSHTTRCKPFRYENNDDPAGCRNYILKNQPWVQTALGLEPPRSPYPRASVSSPYPEIEEC